MSILICYDGSESAKHLLAVTEKVVGNASTVLLNVWSPPERVLADAFADRQDDGGPTYDELETWVRERAADTLNDGQTLAGSLGLAVTPRSERNRSTVPDTILEIADELDAELIVTGTHGTTAVQPGLLGSVSGAVVHRARRPVLVVPKDSDR
jgi:nucleotide-binding universal stress UspA family protein